jgi:hypothetical protein
MLKQPSTHAQPSLLTDVCAQPSTLTVICMLCMCILTHYYVHAVYVHTNCCVHTVYVHTNSLLCAY